MESFIRSIELRWSDLDPNFHLRHSVFYDYGATSRLAYLQHHGITADFMRQHAFGLIIFREECVFKKEIMATDKITIDLQLQKAKADFSRWTIKHHVYKNTGIVCAVITIDGAWIDVIKRKLTIPPAEVGQAFDNIPKEDKFEWIE